VSLAASPETGDMLALSRERTYILLYHAPVTVTLVATRRGRGVALVSEQYAGWLPGMPAPRRSGGIGIRASLRC
jgi:hypothetical protein